MTRWREDVWTNLPSVTSSEWWTSEKRRGKRRRQWYCFPHAQSSVSHFNKQQKRTLAVHLSQSLGSLCSSTITKSGVNWSFWLRPVAECRVWFIYCTSFHLGCRWKTQPLFTSLNTACELCEYQIPQMMLWCYISMLASTFFQQWFSYNDVDNRGEGFFIISVFSRRLLSIHITT